SPRRVHEHTALSSGSWTMLAGLCAVATLLTPYGLRMWLVVRDYVGSLSLYLNTIGEFVAPDFRHDSDWVRLVLTLAAAMCIGWQARHRPVRVFVLLLFGVGVYLGFKSARDVWLTVIGAACVIGAAAPGSRTEL